MAMEIALGLWMGISHRDALCIQVNSSLANWIRVRAEDLWPSDYWNVLVEKSPGNS